MSPLILFPEETIVVTPAYAGSIDYYARMAAYGHVVINPNIRFNRHDHTARRCEIVGTSGRLKLSVPTKKLPAGNNTVADLEVDFILDWRRNHWGAFYSAYGRSPFFDYYADRFHAIYQQQFAHLIDYDLALDSIIRPIIGIETDVKVLTAGESAEICTDIYTDILPTIADVEYYQVWRDRNGFQSRLSVLDLIFNLGPESPLLIKKMLKGE